MFDADAADPARSGSEFWRRNRLPRSPLPPAVRFERWFATDSEDNYARVGNRAFSVDSVGYEFNTLGYRGPELARAPGEALAVFAGDSNTLGVGIPWDRLWTSIVTTHLETRWDLPVRQCNVAWKGTGSDYAAMIVHQCIDVLRPDIVCVLWPDSDRISWFPDASRQVHFMPNRTPPDWREAHDAYLRLATPAQGFGNFVRNFHLVDARLGGLGVPFYWGTVDRLSRELLDRYVTTDGYASWRRVPGDLARDGQHAGVATHAAFAADMIGAIERNLNSERPGDPQRRADPPTGAGAGSGSGSGAGADSPRARRRPWSAEAAARVPRPVLGALREVRLRRRVRAMKRKDPFIY